MAKLLNFSQTALKLGIAQPAVSRQIKELENQLGATLFVRTNKLVELTTTGKELAKTIPLLITSIEENISSSIKNQNELEGLISIICPREVGELLITPYAQKFKQQNPKINFHIEYGEAKKSPEKLMSGEIDFGIGINPANQENIRSYLLLEQNCFLIANKKQKEVYDNIKDANFLSYRKNDPLISIYLKKFHKGVSISQMNLNFQVNSHFSMIAFIKNNPDHFCVLPYYSGPVKTAIDNKEVKVFKNKVLSSNLYLYALEHKHIPLRFKEFQSFLINELKAL